MKNILIQYCFKNLWFKIFALIAVGLLITSFILPPTGVIDPSVIAATGELFGFASLGAVIKAIDKGLDTSINHKDTSIHIKHDKKD